ncbi:hypothetical protein BSK59_05580 [Paenibacillus odorifer]|uniref:DUF6932 family protein n=1 Tax=Paenibacillus odorifer TaxID=189426 RepID=UPI00096F58B1|nr:hypothetical protein [Paenibacillus odorifer]OME60889.1 hypothetical protein BSK59_05580 [Paenibacillus odorifer]
MTIPDFNENGTLPSGMFSVSWEEFEARFGINHRRKQLINGLKRAVSEFRSAGGKTLYLDGSFVTNKKNPDDFDACYSPNELNPDKLDPTLLDCTKAGRQKQKVKYEGEFFPGTIPADMVGTRYIDFFQKDKRTGLPKGIIILNIEVEP